jgi:hypothetical protein
MKKLILFSTLVFCVSFSYAQNGCRTRSLDQVRTIDANAAPTSEDQFSQNFLCATCFHFVQFAVYQGEVDKYSLKAPQGINSVWLVRHNYTRIRGSEDPGAVYMVKAYSTEEEARGHAQQFKNQGIPCWYNPSLTGATFELLSITE